MNSAKFCQVGIIKALDTNRQPIDPDAAKVGKFFLLKGAGVGFEGDFNILLKTDNFLRRGDNLANACGGSKTWRAATKKA